GSRRQRRVCDDTPAGDRQTESKAWWRWRTFLETLCQTNSLLAVLAPRLRLWTSREQFRHGDSKSLQTLRRRDVAHFEPPLVVRLPLEIQHQHDQVLGVDDPVFGNAGFRVLLALLDQVTFGIAFADDFDHKIGSGPAFRFLQVR